MMESRKIKLFSFFSGSGFLDLGFEMSEFEIVFVNEISPTFLQAYSFSRQKMNIPPPTYGYFNTDINTYLQQDASLLKKYLIDAKKDGSLIGFIGGPPCPDFSIAGKNKGQFGDNGKLSLSYVNLICTMKPDFFLFENVKGLWKTARHREFFENLKFHLYKSGYCTTERLTNALEFGVPQDRERIILLGINKILLKNKNFEKYKILDFPWLSNAKYDIDYIKSINWPTLSPFSENSLMKCPTGIIEDLTVEYWFTKNNVYEHQNANKHFTPRSGLTKMQTIQEGDVSKKCYKRLHRWRYSPTAAYGNNEVHLHPFKCRRLSASEALAVQSLPIDFVLPDKMTLSDMFKTIGNGVPYLLAEGIAITLKEYLEELE